MDGVICMQFFSFPFLPPPPLFFKAVQIILKKIDMQACPRYGDVSHLQCSILLAHLECGANNVKAMGAV